MQALVSGGSSSGKSGFAEDLAMSISRPGCGRIYVATMRPFGREALERVDRHRAMRAKKGFITIERCTGLSGLHVPEGSVVLLECLGNLLANEMFPLSGDAVLNAAQVILEGVSHLRSLAKHLVLVSNDICSDGAEYGEGSSAYRDALALINRSVAAGSQSVVEVCCGIPVYHKREGI